MNFSTIASNMFFLFGDIETGGLDERLKNGKLGMEYYPIFEMAFILTDSQLNQIGEPLRLVIHQDEEAIARSSEWALKAHTKSGLLDEVRASTLSLAQAEQRVIEHLKALAILKYNRDTREGAIFAGNSLKLDRNYFMAQTPTLHDYLHYRQLDVSAFALGARAWNPALAEKAVSGKNFSHKALQDIEECIEEARVFKAAFNAFSQS